MSSSLCPIWVAKFQSWFFFWGEGTSSSWSRFCSTFGMSFLPQKRVWREQNMEEALEYLKIFEIFRKAQNNLHVYIIHVQIANYSCSGWKVGVYKRWVLLYILNAIWLWGLCGGAVRTQDLEALVSNQKSKFKCKHCNFRTYFTSCPGNGNLQTVPPQNMLFTPSNYSWWIVVDSGYHKTKSRC